MASAQTMPVRATRQRAAVMAALAGASDFLSAQELYQVLRDRGEAVGLSTVYRTLQGMAAADQIDAIVGDDGEAWYRRCEAAHHHHHLVCRVCGCTVEVTNPRMERWADQIAQEHDFSDVSHVLEVFGVCRGCVDAERGADAPQGGEQQ